MTRNLKQDQHLITNCIKAVTLECMIMSRLCNTLANIVDTYGHAKELWLGPDMSIELDLFT